MRYLWILTLVACVYACGDERRPGRTSPYIEQNKPTAQGRSVQTVMDSTVVVAGQDFEVECRVWRDGEVVADQTVVVFSEPAADSTQLEDNKATLKATQAGEMYITCETGDGVVRDPQGKRITVIPAEIANLETTLSAASAAAGLPVDVFCQGLDAFGNVLEEAEVTGVQSDASISIDGSSTLGYAIRGTLVGGYSVACMKDDLTDDTPAIFTVTPGVVTQSQTWVSPESIQPDETFSVSCTATDVYGNTVDGQDSAIFVSSPDGTSSMADIQVQSDGTYNIQIAGTYYVFCYVPGTLAGDESPAVLLVEPGPPYSWQVDLPTTECFSLKDKLPLSVWVYDAWDNLIESPPLSVVITPQTGINLQEDGSHLIEEEGAYAVSVSMDASVLATGATIQSPQNFNLVVDGLGPTISITSPERAAYVVSSSTSQNVTLAVSDTVSEITAFTFNGVDKMAQLGQGDLSLSMDSRWGLNIIEASAGDACGNQTLLSQSFLQSDAFASTSGSITHGVSAYLDQDVLDDGNRSDIDDLGTLAWEVLKGMDLDSEIPQELGSGSVLFGAIDYVATKGGALTYDEPTLDYLYALDNGLSLYLTITNFSLPIDVDLDPIIGSSIEGTADIIATAIYVDLSKVALSMVGGQVVASIAEDDIAITFSENSPAVVNLTLTGYEWLDELLEDLGDIAMDIFKPSIEEELEQTVRDEIPPMLEEIFNDFEMDASFTVPEPLSSTMNLSSSLDGMVFSGPAGSGQAVLELAAQVAPGSVGENIRDDAKGVGLKSGNGLSWPSSANFALGIKDDVFNQILWALWYGGTFDMAQSAVDELLTGESAQGVDVSFAFHLPPVLMEDPDDPAAFQIGIGDAYVALDIDTEQALGIATDEGTLEVGVYLSALLGATLGFDASTNVLTLNVASEPDIYVHVASLTNPAYQIIVTMLIEETIAYLLPQFFDGFVESFPLPEFDVGGKAGLASGAIWRLANGQLQTRQSGDAYTILSGDLALVE